MSNYTRVYIPGGTFFFTLVTYKRRPFLTDELSRKILRQAWQQVQAKMPFSLDAICLLPDHIHFLLTLTEEDSDYSKRIKMLKSLFTIHYLKAGGQDGIRNKSRNKKGEAAIWQRRFWEHMIRDENDYESHFNYIHYNPVHHQYTRKANDWAWSSFHRYVKSGIYTPDWGEDVDLSQVRNIYME